MASEEFAVIGYTPDKMLTHGFGSLLLAKPDEQHGWTYVGRVGSGFTDRQVRELAARIGSAGQRQPTVSVPGTSEAVLRSALWFEPLFVVEVYSRGMSEQGVLRQPFLKAIRLDKQVNDLSGRN